MSDIEPTLRLPISFPRGPETLVDDLRQVLAQALVEEGIEVVPLENPETLDEGAELEWLDLLDDPDRVTPGFIFVGTGYPGNHDVVAPPDDGVIAHIDAVVDMHQLGAGRPAVAFTIGDALAGLTEPELSATGTPIAEVLRQDGLRIVDVTDDPGLVKRMMLGMDE